MYNKKAPKLDRAKGQILLRGVAMKQHSHNLLLKVYLNFKLFSLKIKIEIRK